RNAKRVGQLLIGLCPRLRIASVNKDELLAAIQALSYFIDGDSGGFHVVTSGDSPPKILVFRPQLVHTLRLAPFLRRLMPRRGGSLFGSPVAAFLTSPPSSSAFSASLRLVNAENGSVSAMSFSLTYLSRCLIKSH